MIITNIKQVEQLLGHTLDSVKKFGYDHQIFLKISDYDDMCDLLKSALVQVQTLKYLDQNKDVDSISLCMQQMLYSRVANDFYQDVDLQHGHQALSSIITEKELKQGGEVSLSREDLSNMCHELEKQNKNVIDLAQESSDLRDKVDEYKQIADDCNRKAEKDMHQKLLDIDNIEQKHNLTIKEKEKEHQYIVQCKEGDLQILKAKNQETVNQIVNEHKAEIETQRRDFCSQAENYKKREREMALQIHNLNRKISDITLSFSNKIASSASEYQNQIEKINKDYAEHIANIYKRNMDTENTLRNENISLMKAGIKKPLHFSYPDLFGVVAATSVSVLVVSFAVYKLKNKKK